jgi:hypothetical protein
LADRSAAAGCPAAAYLYLLHLDGPALAWEYLRRNPDYRRDWRRCRRRPEAAQAWGLRLLEDPARDARDAHPVWFPDPETVLLLYPDADPPPDAAVFEFWRVPGHKHLVHDGKRLLLAADWPGGGVRLALAPGLADGRPYLYGVRACAAPCGHFRTLAVALDALAVAHEAAPAAAVRSRPAPTALRELHTVQALDAALAGASLRDTAVDLFGAAAVAAGWYADGGLRSRVRRLVRRGQSLMRGGYRRLARLD